MKNLLATVLAWLIRPAVEKIIREEARRPPVIKCSSEEFSKFKAHWDGMLAKNATDPASPRWLF